MLILPANSLTGGYEIANSLRFDGGSSDSLTRTASSGNRKTYTFSAWLKRTKLSVAGVTGDRIFSGYVDGSNWTTLYFGADDRLQLYQWSSGTPNVAPSRLFRDVSAWYHIILAVDTTQATSSDRVKMYVNGVQETSFNSSNYPTLNQDTNINASGSTFYIGLDPNDDCNMYMSEIYFIDGQQLTPTDFGEFDQDSGIWKPIKYTGTYGTNGFYLDFENSGSLGTDQSGNGNNFTVNNLTSIDQVTDTPTNNYATLNPLDLNSTATYSFSEGNVKTANTNFTRSTFAHSVGKWYVESKCVTTACWNGVREIGQDVNNEWTTNSVSLFIGGATLYISGVSQGLGGYGSSWSANDIMMMALDLDSGTQKIYFGKNGGWWNGSTYGASSPSTGVTLTSGITWQFQFGSGSGTSTQEVNFGNPSFTISSGNSDANGYGNFEYSVPSGYYALNTKNLAQYG